VPTAERLAPSSCSNERTAGRRGSRTNRLGEGVTGFSGSAVTFALLMSGFGATIEDRDERVAPGIAACSKRTNQSRTSHAALNRAQAMVFLSLHIGASRLVGVYVRRKRMGQAHTSRSPSAAVARHARYSLSRVCCALLLCAGCSLDERTLLATGAIAGSSASGGERSGVDPAPGGGGGAAGEAPLPRCFYTGSSAPPGCETLVKNPGFDANVAGWTAEDVGLTEGWLNVDANGDQGSGSLVVTNLNFKSDDSAKGGTAGGGARQCISVISGVTYDLAADIFIPSGQGMGFQGDYTSVAALSVFFYPDTACAMQTEGNFTSDAVQDSNKWLHMEGSTTAPKDAQSMAVRLATLKPFRQYTFEAHFDNVFVREHSTP
jgi:hypothetical protein